MTQKFNTLALKSELLESLESLNYHSMTPIQAKSLPPILDGHDVIGQGKTGSGKTAAFSLGILQKLDVKLFRVQALVLCPTRELADQVAREIRTLARATHNVKVLTLCGGMPFGPQVGSLEHGAHIIVGTPGRIEEHVRKERLNLDHLTMLVLDEADRMLDMGFQESLDAILAIAPKQRQTLLFSATFPSHIDALAKRVMNKAQHVKTESLHAENTITQHFYKVDDESKRLNAIMRLLLHFNPESCVVFCNTKREAQEIADELCEFGFSALAIHGDLEQKDRDRALIRFMNKSISILVATDVAARGLDVDSLEAVINYQVSRDPEVHTHRIGRTGRAGSKGVACTLFTDRDAFKLASIEGDVDPITDAIALPSEKVLSQAPRKPEWVTLQIDGGKKSKVRPGDILGALTGDGGLSGSQVGKISVYPLMAYVAVQRSVSKLALTQLQEGKIKGRSFKSRLIRR